LGDRHKHTGTLMTKLDKQLRRELEIEGAAYTLTIDPDGLRLVEKGRRKGIELTWRDMVSGDAALAVALQASVRANS
jgi:hypothetical protein